MASNNLAAQPTRGFADRLQNYWDHPHPQGLVAILKAALNGIGEAVQGSIAATTTPSTEQEAFWQNQGRERGPIGALKAATLLTPLAPGAGSARLAAPVLDALRSGPSSLAASSRILPRSTAGGSIGFPSVRTEAPVPVINEFLRYLNPSERVAATAGANPESATIRFVSRNTNHPSNACLVLARTSDAPAHREVALQKPILTPTADRFVWGGGTADRSSTRIAPTGLFDTKTPVVPEKPIVLPPPLPGGQPAGNSPPKPPKNTGVGAGGNDEDCKEERKVATEICEKAAADGWKSDYDVGPKPKESGEPWTVADCMRGLISQRCGGNPWDEKRPKFFKKKKGKKGKRAVLVSRGGSTRRSPGGAAEHP